MEGFGMNDATLKTFIQTLIAAQPMSQRDLIDRLNPKEMTGTELVLLCSKLAPYIHEALKQFAPSAP